MKMKKFMKATLAVLFTLFLVCRQVAMANITPPPSLPGTQISCGHPTPGWTKTLTTEWLPAAQLSIFHYDFMLDNLVNNQTPKFSGTWDFQISDQATGTINVTTYTPFDGPGACQHGANIKILPNLILPDDQKLQWMQTYSYSAYAPGYNNSASGIVDPPVNYQVNKADDLPFYYDIPGRGGDDVNWGMPADRNFHDSPNTQIADSLVPHGGTWNFSTLITSWDGTFHDTGDNVVTVYGRLDWGYSYQCVPDPASLTLALLGLGTVGVLRRRIGIESEKRKTKSSKP
ncbi:MAG: PEP-CTERM sorting domain-containing protein [Sedimentisphaerales bacterium]|jgi:uncharacterized protein (TIGR03382 family)